MKKLALVFALAVLVAACGDVDGSRSTTTAAAAAAETSVGAAVEVEEGTAGDDHDDDADSHAEESSEHADDDHEDVADQDDAGDDHDNNGTADKDRTVQVAMDEFSFVPGDFEARAGETVQFVVTNVGVVEHEFRLSNEHRIEEHLAAGHADHHEGSADGHHEGGDVVLLVPPGETASITVTFGEDTTLYSEVACLIPGHYEAGMKAPMSISA